MNINNFQITINKKFSIWGTIQLRFWLRMLSGWARLIYGYFHHWEQWTKASGFPKFDNFDGSRKPSIQKCASSLEMMVFNIKAFSLRRSLNRFYSQTPSRLDAASSLKGRASWILYGNICTSILAMRHTEAGLTSISWASLTVKVPASCFGIPWLLQCSLVSLLFSVLRPLKPRRQRHS